MYQVSPERLKSSSNTKKQDGWTIGGTDGLRITLWINRYNEKWVYLKTFWHTLATSMDPCTTSAVR